MWTTRCIGMQRYAIIALMKEIRSKRISARITPTLYKKVLKVAKKKRWSVSDMVEEGLFQITARLK